MVSTNTPTQLSFQSKVINHDIAQTKEEKVETKQIQWQLTDHSPSDTVTAAHARKPSLLLCLSLSSSNFTSQNPVNKLTDLSTVSTYTPINFVQMV